MAKKETEVPLKAEILKDELKDSSLHFALRSVVAGRFEGPELSRLCLSHPLLRARQERKPRYEYKCREFYGMLCFEPFLMKDLVAGKQPRAVCTCGLLL